MSLAVFETILGAQVAYGTILTPDQKLGDLPKS
jgi:hypothetical protein